MEKHLEECRVLVAKGRLEDAISKLIDITKPRKTSYYTEILLLSSQLSVIARKESLGLGYENEDFSRISLSILKTLNELENHNNLSEGFEKEAIKAKKKFIQSESNRELLEFQKDTIIEVTLENGIELTKIRVEIKPASMNFELTVASSLTLDVLKNKESVIKNLLFDFHQIEFNVYLLKWIKNKIHIYIHDDNLEEIETAK